jgi:transposase
VVMKHYPPVFKAVAMALYRSPPEATIAQSADGQGVNRETLRSWVSIDDGKMVGAHRPKTPGPTTAPQSAAAEAELAAPRKNDLPTTGRTSQHGSLRGPSSTPTSPADTNRGPNRSTTLQRCSRVRSGRARRDTGPAPVKPHGQLRRSAPVGITGLSGIKGETCARVLTAIPGLTEKPALHFA